MHIFNLCSINPVKAALCLHTCSICMRVAKAESKAVTQMIPRPLLRANDFHHSNIHSHEEQIFENLPGFIPLITLLEKRSSFLSQFRLGFPAVLNKHQHSAALMLQLLLVLLHQTPAGGHHTHYPACHTACLRQKTHQLVQLPSRCVSSSSAGG